MSIDEFDLLNFFATLPEQLSNPSGRKIDIVFYLTDSMI